MNGTFAYCVINDRDIISELIASLYEFRIWKKIMCINNEIKIFSCLLKGANQAYINKFPGV